MSDHQSHSYKNHDFQGHNIKDAAEAIISSLASRGITATADYNPSGEVLIRDTDDRYAMVKRVGSWGPAIKVDFGRLGADHTAALGLGAFQGDARHLGHSVGVRLAGMEA